MATRLYGVLHVGSMKLTINGKPQRSFLLMDKNVVAYLGLAEAAKSGLASDEASNEPEPEDFS